MKDKPDNITEIKHLVCAICKKPIAKGSPIYNVATPSGNVPVHKECMR